MGKICTSLAHCIAAIYDGKLTIADIDMVYEGTIIGDEQNYGEWSKRYSFIEDTAKSVEILKQLVHSNKVTVMAHQCNPDDTVYSVNPSSDGLDIELHELEKSNHPKYATKINGKLYEFHPTRTILSRNDWADSPEELICEELREAFTDQIANRSDQILDFSSNGRIAMMKIAFPQYAEVINTIIRQYSELVERSTERNGQIETIKYDKVSSFSKNIPTLFESLIQEKDEKENDELKMQMVSFNKIKDLYDEGIIKPYEEFCEDRDIEKFNAKSYDICSTIQIAPWDNPKWRIVGGKNLFGLQPSVSTEGNNTKMFLVPCIGKFRLDRFIGLFGWQNAWDISDISSRSEENKYKELREFYHMNNRQVFEKFGLELLDDTEQNRIFITNALLLDSLLNGRYSDIIRF